MELYWGSGSAFAWRVMLGLLFKGMNYEDHLLSFSDREHKSPHYTQINPRGQVPTLVDGEVVVTESIAILAYLDRVFPRSMLFGATASDAGRVWRAVMEVDTYVAPKCDEIVRALFRGRWETQKAALKETLQDLYTELDLIERATAEGPFDALDCMLVPLWERLHRASRKTGALEIGLLPLPVSRWPKQMARLEAVRALEGFGRTYPPHWR